MTTGNRRKKANAEMTERNSDLSLNSALVDKAIRGESILPDSQRHIHISKIEGVVNDYNIHEATKAVIIPMMTLVCARSQ
jgi:hypothetical protein